MAPTACRFRAERVHAGARVRNRRPRLPLQRGGCGKRERERERERGRGGTRRPPQCSRGPQASGLASGLAAPAGPGPGRLRRRQLMVCPRALPPCPARPQPLAAIHHGNREDFTGCPTKRGPHQGHDRLWGQSRAAPGTCSTCGASDARADAAATPWRVTGAAGPGALVLCAVGGRWVRVGGRFLHRVMPYATTPPARGEHRRPRLNSAR